MKLAVVAVGGALGAMARYGVAIFIAQFWTSQFPLATFLINVSGSFILGFFTTFAVEKSSIDPLWRLLVATGFVGAYTTFSTFEYESQRLVEGGATMFAVANVVGSIVAGFAAVQLGVLLARR